MTVEPWTLPVMMEETVSRFKGKDFLEDEHDGYTEGEHTLFSLRCQGEKS
jgi:hypothetical protein